MVILPKNPPDVYETYRTGPGQVRISWTKVGENDAVVLEFVQEKCA